MSDQPTTVHAGPPFGTGLTSCCRRPPLELPRDHQVTYNLGDVTCGRPERQTWEQRIPGTDVPLTRIHLHVEEDGRARVHEAVLAQLLDAAGWERTA